MLLPNLGQTRSSLTRSHLLQTPDTFVRAPLPGMKDAVAIVHAGPALGARFVQYTAEIQRGGALGPTNAQRFLYVLEGEVTAGEHALLPGGYAFVPEGEAVAVSAQTSSRIAIIEKPYQALGGIRAPGFLARNESDVSEQQVFGDSSLRMRVLLPEGPEHDFAVNTLTYEPGASLSMVEIHVMEHGLLMLEGGGIYRLADSWYPVSAGDFIWMAPYCPQWFGAIGKTSAKYLIYKDWNRNP